MSAEASGCCRRRQSAISSPKLSRFSSGPTTKRHGRSRPWSGARSALWNIFSSASWSGPGEDSFVADSRPTSSSSASISGSFNGSVWARTVGLLPRVDTAVDVAGGGETRILCRLYGHGRALPEGTIEHQALVCRAGQFVQHAARLNVTLKVRIGRVQRTGNHAVLLAFGALAQVDQHDVAAGDEVPRLRRGDCPTAAGDLLLCEALPHVRRDRDVHHLRVGQVQVVHQCDVFVYRFDLQAGIVALLLTDRANRVAFVVVRREHHGFVG